MRAGTLLRLLVVGMCAILLAAFVRLAWVSDDAYITLRTVENVFCGHGFVWNVGERVQTYTHPAWMLLLCAARWCTGECYYATIALSLVLASSAAVWLARIPVSAAGAAVVLAVLLGSRAVGDYATSGLETPLSAFFICCLARADRHTGSAPRRLLLVTLVVAAMATTRLDLLVLGAPIVVRHLRGVRRGVAIRTLLAGLVPLGAWWVFAIVYYGSPFPVTAYAKALSCGVSRLDLLCQGGHYFAFSLQHDPTTIAVLAIGGIAGFLHRELRCRAFAFGIAAYCGYVAMVGGDFMAGRFLLPPTIAATVVLARWLGSARPTLPIVLGIAAASSSLLAGWPAFVVPGDDGSPAAAPHGIVDERRFYYARSGLLSPELSIPIPGAVSARLRAEGRTEPLVLRCAKAGRDPFESGDLVHFVDCWILDPLLMRLPVVDPNEWRIGHFTRGVPVGYLESIATGDERVAHAGLRAFHADLRSVISAPLFDADRLRAMARIWSGAHSAGVRDYVESEYRVRAPRDLRALDLPAGLPARGTFWFDDPRITILGPGGVTIRFDEGSVSASAVRVSLAPLHRYTVEWSSSGDLVHRAELLAKTDSDGRAESGALEQLRVVIGQDDYVLPLPEDARKFDAVRISCPESLVLVATFGGLELLP